MGRSPEPHNRKEPKSLYQSPSGALGFDLTQAWRRSRSGTVIRRSSTRSRICRQRGRGRSEKRIFGNRVSPEDGANQLFSRLLFSRRLMLVEEPPMARFQTLPCVKFRLNTPLGQCYQSPADCEVALPGDPLHFTREIGGDRYALADGFRGRSSDRFAWSGHFIYCN